MPSPPRSGSPGCSTASKGRHCPTLPQCATSPWPRRSAASPKRRPTSNGCSMKSTDLESLRAKLEPPWDDLRERRVLTTVLEKRRQNAAPRHRAWVLVSAAAFVVLALVAWGGARMWHRGAAPVATVTPLPGQSTIALADGSTAVLAAEASMQIEEQRPERVHLVQSKGSVRYEVRPDPAREFVVSAADTVVRVRGTVFTVDV